MKALKNDRSPSSLHSRSQGPLPLLFKKAVFCHSHARTNKPLSTWDGVGSLLLSFIRAQLKLDFVSYLVRLEFEMCHIDMYTPFPKVDSIYSLKRTIESF